MLMRKGCLNPLLSQETVTTNRVTHLPPVGHRGVAESPLVGVWWVFEALLPAVSRENNPMDHKDFKIHKARGSPWLGLPWGRWVKEEKGKK